MKSRIRFTCPRCPHGTKIEELVENARFTSPVLDIEEGDEEIHYGDPKILEGDLIHYQCVNCGFPIEGVDCVEELAEWLEERAMLLTEPEDLDEKNPLELDLIFVAGKRARGEITPEVEAELIAILTSN